MQIAHEIDFDNMNRKPRKKEGSIASALMNKGKIGSWQEKLSEEQSPRMDRITGARFANTGMQFDFGADEK